jgi:anaerobic magnesium-protoporphyrin IX monomethyl ester cyclase
VAIVRVALISCYSQVESTGLRVLSACLKRTGFETGMIFLPDIQEMMVETDYAARHLAAPALQQIADVCAGADLIGIGVMTASFLIAAQLTEALHASLNVPIIWGGVHPTVRPEECLRYADLACIGEGERSIVELARRIAKRRDYGNVHNLASLDTKGRLVKNPLYPLERDLDALPFPDYEFKQHYVLHEGRVVPFSQELMHYYLTDLGSWAPGPVYGVLTTRGCPYRCAYCVNSTLASIYPDWCKLRRRSPANVIAEIQAVRARLSAIQAIAIRDDTFLANPEPYIAEFSRLYRTQVGLPFRVHTTAQTADPAKLRHLVEAGLHLVIMGIQSGSPRIQKLYNRHISNEQIVRAARVIHSFQRWVPRPMYDVITDNPYETADDRLETLRLVYGLPQPYRLSLYSLTFYPGTDIHSRAKADGLIEGEEEAIYRRNFQKVDANYYNLALFFHHLNLPRPFLHLLTQRFVFNLLSRGPLNRICGWLLSLLLALRLSRNKRLYSERRLHWLAGGETNRHV